MKGWIEVHCTGQDRDAKVEVGRIRSFQVSNLRWVASCIHDHEKGALQTIGDLFIVVTKENYEELCALIEEAGR